MLSAITFQYSRSNFDEEIFMAKHCKTEKRDSFQLPSLSYLRKAAFAVKMFTASRYVQEIMISFISTLCRERET